MYLSKFLDQTLLAFLIAIVCVNDTFASNGPCDIDIAGVTVLMSRDEAIAVWTVEGLHDISAHSSFALTDNLHHIAAFSSVPYGTPKAPGQYSATWTKTSNGIKVGADYHVSDRGVQVFQKRKQQFCPDGQVINRVTGLICNGNAAIKENISKGPNDRTKFPNCSYGISLRANGLHVSESISLHNTDPSPN